QKRDGKVVVMGRNGQIKIVDENGRERESHTVPYGAYVRVKEGESVAARTTLAEWDAYANPILTEVGGAVKFGDLIEGVSMEETLNEVTGLSQANIIESRDPSALPRISIKVESTGDTKKT